MYPIINLKVQDKDIRFLSSDVCFKTHEEAKNFATALFMVLTGSKHNLQFYPEGKRETH